MNVGLDYMKTDYVRNWTENHEKYFELAMSVFCIVMPDFDSVMNAFIANSYQNA